MKLHRYALKDLLVATTVVAVALAWLLDRRSLTSQVETLVTDAKARESEIRFLNSARIELVKALEQNERNLREMRRELRSLRREVEDFNREIDLETLVSGVDTIEMRGNRFKDTVFVTFTNGQSFFHNATTREVMRAQRLLVENRMR